jgi:hypothetical protein
MGGGRRHGALGAWPSAAAVAGRCASDNPRGPDEGKRCG